MRSSATRPSSISSRRRRRAARPVRRWAGREFAAVASTSIDGDTWSRVLTREVPSVALDSSRTLAELATATAGFREQFYGLAPFVVDLEEGELPRLVTCGV